MCGIAGMHRRGDAPISKAGVLADQLLLGIEERGRHATGYLAMLDSGLVQMQKEPVPASRFVRGRKRFDAEARTVLLHTRFATVGAAHDPRNAHPVANGTCAAVHNGTIRNHAEVFAKLGVRRHATVDSEVIPAVVSVLGWERAAKALGMLTGGAATAIVSNEHPDEVLLARLAGYPLVVYVTPDLVVWASTAEAIEDAWLFTYDEEPVGGEWIDVPSYTLLRVNGEVREEPVPEIRNPRRLLPTRTQRSRPVSGTTAKRRRKRSRKSGHTQLALPAGTSGHVRATERTGGSYPGPAPEARRTPHSAFEREPWMEDIVRDLMRTEGWERGDAEQLVFGWAAADDEHDAEWDDEEGWALPDDSAGWPFE